MNAITIIGIGVFVTLCVFLLYVGRKYGRNRKHGNNNCEFLNKLRRFNEAT